VTPRRGVEVFGTGFFLFLFSNSEREKEQKKGKISPEILDKAAFQKNLLFRTFLREKKENKENEVEFR
jgi:hypothetical protein